MPSFLFSTRTRSTDPWSRRQLEGLTIVTRDERIAAYDAETLAA